MNDFLIFYAPWLVVMVSVGAAFVVALKTKTH